MEAGSRCLVLTSRSAKLEKGELAELARSDAAVFVLRADAASKEATM